MNLKRMISTGTDNMSYEESNEPIIWVKEMSEVFTIEQIKNLVQTIHLEDERKTRIDMSFSESNNARIERVFLVEKGHRDGLEIHIVLNDATIFIINNDSRKLITILFARPEQIERLYRICNETSNTNLKPPKKLLAKARINKEKGRNNL